MEDDCAICTATVGVNGSGTATEKDMAGISVVARLPCGHCFCDTCILTWFHHCRDNQSAATCCVCRRQAYIQSMFQVVRVCTIDMTAEEPVETLAVDRVHRIGD